MYRVNARCSMPLVHFTIQQEYRGLSRIGRSLTASYGGAPNVRNYDKKKQKLVDDYTIRVEMMVRGNNGILAFDNWCNIHGSPHLSIERDTAYIKANFTVVGVSKYHFDVRPKFAWRWVDEKIAVTSLPRDLDDLKQYENKVFFVHAALISFPIFRYFPTLSPHSFFLQMENKEIVLISRFMRTHL